MRINQNIAIIICLVIAGIVGFLWYQKAYASLGSLQVYNGSSSLIRDGKVTPGTTGAAVRLHDHLKTADQSRVAIVLKDGSVIRIEANSEVAVDTLSYNGTTLNNAVFTVLSGRLWSHVSPLQTNASFQVETPTTVATVRGTSFNVDYLNNQSTVYVYRHQVLAALKNAPSVTQQIDQGYFLVLNNDTAKDDLSKGEEPVKPSYIDDWIRFNQAEDDKLDGKATEQANVPTPSFTTLAAVPTNTPKPVITPKPTPSPTAKSTPKPTSKPTTSPSPTPTPTPTSPVVLTKLTLSSDKTNLTVRDSTSFHVTGTYSDGSTQDLSNQVSFNQVPARGTISYPGLFTATSSGDTAITATFQGATTPAITLHIAPLLTSLSVSCAPIPNSPTLQYQCTATAHYSDQSSQDVTKNTKWSLTNQANDSISSTGVYTPGGQKDTIVGTYQSASGTYDYTPPRGVG